MRDTRLEPMEEATFTRFPSWMWANTQVLEFIKWLRHHNQQLEPEQRAGFYGLDLYSMYSSIHAVINYLEDVDVEAAAVARRRYGCLTPRETDPATYGAMALTQQHSSWAHNSHIGNAQATEMSARGEINVGYLCRRHFGQSAYLIGFGTHQGTVAAASNWGAPVEIKKVRPSHPRSYERVFHDSEVSALMLPLRYGEKQTVKDLMPFLLERAIGVIYRPETELQSHYFSASPPGQFDEYIWFDETQAVSPLRPESGEGLPETFPFGL